MSDLRLYKGKRAVSVPIDHLFNIVKTVIAHGNEEDFRKTCRDNGLAITAKPDVVNAVKQHLYDNGAHLKDDFAASVQRSDPSPPGQPPTCFPNPKDAVASG